MVKTKLRATESKPRTKPAKASPVTQRQVNPRLMESALRAAGGNTRRLHFHEDGSVVVLNFEGQACPECARVEREAQAKAKKPARKKKAKS